MEHGSQWHNTPSQLRHSVTLRQLNAFGMRNIAIAGTAGGDLMDLYFKLLVDGREMYKSEVEAQTLNPVWLPFELEEAVSTELNAHHLLSAPSFEVHIIQVLRPSRERHSLELKNPSADTSEQPLLLESSEAVDVEESEDLEEEGWQLNSRFFGDTNRNGNSVGSVYVNEQGEKEQRMLLLQFHMRDLEPLPVPLTELNNLPFNTCLFEFNHNCYVHHDTMEILQETKVLDAKIARRKGSAIKMKEYSLHDGVDHLQQSLHLQSQIDRFTEENKELKEEAGAKVTQAMHTIDRDQKRRSLETRVQALRQQVEQKKERISRLKLVVDEERKTFETDIHVPKALLSTMHMGMRYKDEKQGILERRCEVLRTAHRLRSRQAELVHGLSLVYPIEADANGEYKIRDIRLSTADLSGFGRGDEESVSTALGYIAHLVFMLGKYLRVNLRYQIKPYSSRSYVCDDVNEPQEEYPLYKKGIERERYDRAIGFLRKDVEQILFARGLDPTQNSSMLRRLKELMDTESLWLQNDLKADPANPGALMAK